jgi:hypothetical protein
MDVDHILYVLQSVLEFDFLYRKYDSIKTTLMFVTMRYTANASTCLIMIITTKLDFICSVVFGVVFCFLFCELHTLTTTYCMYV